MFPQRLDNATPDDVTHGGSPDAALHLSQLYHNSARPTNHDPPRYE